LTKPFNILITAASRRVAMIRGFRTALDELGVEGSLQVCDTDPDSAGHHFADKSHHVPLAGSPDYGPRLLAICRDENIGMIVPTIDEEIPIFGRLKRQFEAIGVIPLISDERVGEISGDKKKTALFFAKHNLPFAPTLLPDEIDFDAVTYPLFIKPRYGRGSVHAFPVRDERELRFFLDFVEEPVVQPFLTGKEYTIDVLAARDGTILSVVPRERMVIRSGVCDRGITHRDETLMEVARKACEELGIVGPVNLQCKVDKGKPVFFEINVRFSGAIQLTVASGANFFRMIIEEALGISSEPQIGQFKDRFFMTSYEESLFQQL